MVSDGKLKFRVNPDAPSSAVERDRRRRGLDAVRDTARRRKRFVCIMVGMILVRRRWELTNFIALEVAEPRFQLVAAIP